MPWVRVEGSQKMQWVSPAAARGLERAIREEIAMQSPEEAEAQAQGSGDPSAPTSTVRAVEIVAQAPIQRRKFNPLPEELENSIRDLRQSLKGMRAGTKELENVYLQSSLSLVESDNLFARSKGAAALLKLMESRRKQECLRAQARREHAYAERLRHGVNKLSEQHVNELLAKNRPRIGVPKRIQ